ncbi:uncharacterized protein LOC116945841 isoform X3 [Petromyzon marinus]|uniref:Uncharacterized protein LOC116945841 isoform X1 n=1 Tax=Petromyzon marinus TaxID=7757 RepID=A0AAJ7TGV3_PETMA|nr:uncharacterized protein LOC116945841 isoform X1 [Petromyzon marinus]
MEEWGRQDVGDSALEASAGGDPVDICTGDCDESSTGDSSREFFTGDTPAGTCAGNSSNGSFTGNFSNRPLTGDMANGSSTGDGFVTDIFAGDPATGLFSICGELPSPRGDLSVFVSDLLVFSGHPSVSRLDFFIFWRGAPPLARDLSAVSVPAARPLGSESVVPGCSHAPSSSGPPASARDGGRSLVSFPRPRRVPGRSSPHRALATVAAETRAKKGPVVVMLAAAAFGSGAQARLTSN